MLPRAGGLFALLAAAALAPGAFGLEPEDLAERWRWRTFDREEGLPAGAIHALGHDRDDFLYAGTDRGLLRYNGFVWTQLEAAERFTGGPVEKVLDFGGDVYAATASDVWLARYGLELKRILRGQRVLLAVGPLGGVYAVDAAARAHYVLEKEEAVRVDEAVPLVESEVFDYAIDDHRWHWLATQDGPYRRDIRTRFRWKLDTELGPELSGRPCQRLFLLRRQVVAHTPAAAAPSPAPPVYELWGLFGPPGGAAAPRSGRILARRGESGWQTVTVDPAGPAIADLVLDGEGNYLASSDEGRTYLSADGKAWTPVQLGVGSVPLRGGLLDPHGYLWFRAGTSSIVRFDGGSRRWERYQRGLGLPSNNVLNVIEAGDGSVWAGTEEGVFHYRPGAVAEPEAFLEVGGAPFRKITGLAEDRTGKVWIAGESFKGAFFFHEGSWHRFEPRGAGGPGAPDPGIAAHSIRRISTDRGGDLWFLTTGRAQVAAEDGVAARPGGYLAYRYSASVYTLSSFRAVELPYGPANDLLQAQDRTYWIATDEGLVRWSPSTPEEPRLYTEAAGLRVSRVWGLAEAADGSIWLCYDPGVVSGVTRMKGDRFETFDERNGLVSPNAWAIASAVTPEGSDIWFGTDRGIIRFDGECWYNYPLASLEPQASRALSLTMGLDGQSVLVGTVGQGIFRFRRDERRRPRITLLDSQRTAEGQVAFRWDGRDFKNETPPAELRFRTRIDDEPWTPFGPERARSVAGLAPGEHVFYVEMRDLDGNANREKYSLRFLVPSPPVALSPRFLLVAGGFAGGLALAALVLYLASRARRAPLLGGSPAGLLSSFPGAAVVIDGEGRVRQLGGKGLAALGLAPAVAEEVRGRPAELLPVFQTPEGRAALAAVLRGEAVTREGIRLSTQGESAADVTAFPLIGPAGEAAGGRPSGAIVLLEDTTRSKAAAELTERARRLGALQDLALRVAVELERRGAGGAEALAGQLRRFAGEEAAPPEAVALDSLLEAILGKRANGAEAAAAGLRLPPSLELDLRGQTGLWKARVDREGIGEALAEVIRNAADAMPGGGRLTIRLRNRRLEDDPGDLEPGRYVEVEVVDTGAGISASEIERACEPFYSTKARDRARGLGLSIAYGVVRRHRGDLRIASSPGAGTTVSVLLPADPSG